MTSVHFCFWLQGFFEVQKPTEITPEQTQMIKNHLNLVFKHEIDPSMGDANHQHELNEIHAGKEKITFPAFPESLNEFSHNINQPGETLLRC